jgi:hypothetical protein
MLAFSQVLGTGHSRVASNHSIILVKCAANGQQIFENLQRFSRDDSTVDPSRRCLEKLTHLAVSADRSRWGGAEGRHPQVDSPPGFELVGDSGMAPNPMAARTKVRKPAAVLAARSRPA